MMMILVLRVDIFRTTFLGGILYFPGKFPLWDVKSVCFLCES